MVYKQAHRTIRIGTTLGEDAVQLASFSGREEMSRLFHFQLQLISMNPKVTPAEVISQNLTFTIDFADGTQRYFNGFARQFSAVDEDVKGRRTYNMHVVPWLWFLTQTSDCRIFQEKSAVEIIEKVFTDRNFSDYETSGIREEHPKREYCVQYRETDFDFVSRLMEEEGIFYFFRHENGKHVLVMGDGEGVYQDCTESVVDFPLDDQQSIHINPHIHSWEHRWKFQTGAWAHTDYNFKTPKQNLLASEKTLVKFQDVAKYEKFDYPGRFPDKGVGKPLARVRMEELETGHDWVEGSSGCKSFTPGGRFSIGKHRVADEKGKSFIVHSIQHEGRENNYDSGGGAEPFEYANQFECFPDSVPYRPSRITPKPVMRGCQTAVVTGPAGEEIHTDEHGRVKVKFYWDRNGPTDDKSSCWVRVSQAHAGANWGYIDLPRVGEEVIVDFLEGDPDLPIIVGRVYNGQNKVPYTLPDEKTRRGSCTKTYKGSGYNEMTMDDTQGKEQIRIHGQYDMNTVVEHDQTLEVGNNRTKRIGVNETNMIGQNQVETIGKNQTLTIGASQTITVGTTQTITVGAAKTEAIGAAYNLAIGAAFAIVVGGAMQTEVGGDQQFSVGGDQGTDVNGKYELSVAKSAKLVCGASQIEMDSSGKIKISGTDITLTAGAGKININQAGMIEIKGPMVRINT